MERARSTRKVAGRVRSSRPKPNRVQSPLSQLTHFVSDGDVPISNNWVENQIRPIAIGRSNWLFAGSLRAGKRAAAIMSLLHSARINGHDPYAYFKDVLDRLPTHPATRIDELLPHRWLSLIHI